MAALSAMVRFFVEARTWGCDRPAEVLAQTHELLRGRLPNASFVSAFMAVIDERRVRYCNAGHSPAVLVRTDGRQEVIAPTGVPLGVDDEPRYAEAEVEFGRGDVLFAATDGLAEARRDGLFFRNTRLPELLGEHATTLEPAAFVRRLYEELQAWAPQLDDDVVILALRRR
jgi:sigma-B regulation protein RsbU (phosphoserine phosphatase)